SLCEASPPTHASNLRTASPYSSVPGSTVFRFPPATNEPCTASPTAYHSPVDTGDPNVPPPPPPLS
ncbi:AGAP012052-PA, partial [Anopheles gambiae str. PEST]